VTTLAPRRDRRRRRRLVTPGRVIAVVAVAAAFVGGIGLGEALHDSPSRGQKVTLERTLGPVPAVVITRETVTVTTSNP
jgi:hypothetical protein